jgi:LacI family transcriptional regulator
MKTSFYIIFLIYTEGNRWQLERATHLESVMNGRVTLHDIAREAGVSAATVDRVLNNREGVRGRTREVVMAVAHRLGYVTEADLPPEARNAFQRVTLVFLLPAGTNSFIKLLGQQLEQQAAERPDIDLRIEELEGFNPTTVAARLAELQGKIDGIGLIAQDHPVVREALRALDRAGVPVVTLASDVQSVPRLAYVGIDNRQAGRLAGQLMGRLLPAQSTLDMKSERWASAASCATNSVTSISWRCAKCLMTENALIKKRSHF